MEESRQFINAHIEEFRNGVNTEYIERIYLGNKRLMYKDLNKLCNIKRVKHRIPGTKKYTFSRIYTLKEDYEEPKYKDVETQTWLW